MASLRQAEAARSAHAEELRRLGAHSIGVERIVEMGKQTFVVVAVFDKHVPPRLPRALDTNLNGRPVRISLIGKIAPPFVAD